MSNHVSAEFSPVKPKPLSSENLKNFEKYCLHVYIRQCDLWVTTSGMNMQTVQALRRPGCRELDIFLEKMINLCGPFLPRVILVYTAAWSIDFTLWRRHENKICFLHGLNIHNAKTKKITIIIITISLLYIQHLLRYFSPKWIDCLFVESFLPFFASKFVFKSNLCFFSSKHRILCSSSIILSEIILMSYPKRSNLTHLFCISPQSNSHGSRFYNCHRKTQLPWEQHKRFSAFSNIFVLCFYFSKVMVSMPWKLDSVVPPDYPLH